MALSINQKQELYFQAIRSYTSLKANEALLLFDSDLHCDSDCEQSYRLLSIATEFPCTAGYLIITLERAMLWLDARYYLSALQQMNVGGGRAKQREHGGVNEVHLYRSEERWLQSLTEILSENTTIYLLSATTPYASYLRWQRILSTNSKRITLALSKIDLRAKFIDLRAQFSESGHHAAAHLSTPHAKSGHHAAAAHLSAPHAKSGYHAADFPAPHAKSGYHAAAHLSTPHAKSVYHANFPAPHAKSGYHAAAHLSTPHAKSGHRAAANLSAPHAKSIARNMEGGAGNGAGNDNAGARRVTETANGNAGVRLIDDVIGKDIRSTRLELVRSFLAHNRLSYFTHNGADDINWILNIRGDHIAYNQLALCYFLFTPQLCSLYLPLDLLASSTRREISERLAEDGVHVLPYQQYRQDVRSLPNKIHIGVMSQTVRCDVMEILRDKEMDITELAMPVERYIKTVEEIDHLRRAVIYEGVAMSRLLACVQHNLDAGKRMTEADVYQLHLDYRSDEQSFFGESFPAIIAYQAHAAEIHYNRSSQSDTRIAPSGMLLIDCGGHYAHGTTDITRVISCGAVGREERIDYTAVLRSHIALATARFPRGSSGSSIDLFARIPLWREMNDYQHGTGHGVGWGFNVHDGPYSLSPHASNKIVMENMVFSNEPGIYRAGSYGVRLESLIRIVRAIPGGRRVKDASGQQNSGTMAPNPATENNGNSTAENEKDRSKMAKHDDRQRFLACEVLSLCPFDRDLIECAMLTTEERKWINSYHHRVATILSPHLSKNEQQWLESQTKPL